MELNPDEILLIIHELETEPNRDMLKVLYADRPGECEVLNYTCMKMLITLPIDGDYAKLSREIKEKAVNQLITTDHTDIKYQVDGYKILEEWEERNARKETNENTDQSPAEGEAEADSDTAGGTKSRYILSDSEDQNCTSDCTFSAIMEDIDEDTQDS